MNESRAMSDAEIDEMIAKLAQEDYYKAEMERTANVEGFQDPDALLNFYFALVCSKSTATDPNDLVDFDFENCEDWEKLGSSAPEIWTLAERCDLSQRLLVEIESLIVELAEVDALFHKKIDLLLLLWIQSPESVESALVDSFFDIVRNYLTLRLFSLNNAPGELCLNVGKNVILPVLRFLNKKSNSKRNENMQLVKSIFSICHEAESSSSHSLSAESETVLYMVAEECISKCGLHFDLETTDQYIRQLVRGLFRNSTLAPNRSSVISGVDDKVGDVSSCGSGQRRFSCSSEHSYSPTDEAVLEQLRIQKIKLLLALIATKKDDNEKSRSLDPKLFTEDCPELESMLEICREFADADSLVYSSLLENIYATKNSTDVMKEENLPSADDATSNQDSSLNSSMSKTSIAESEVETKPG